MAASSWVEPPTAPANLIDQFHSLIQRLYSLREPSEVQTCQAELLDFQKGPFAYDLALRVFDLAGGDHNVRFFAALTVAIKTNQDPGLTPDELAYLVHCLYSWMLSTVNASAPAFVVRRVCTSLVTLFCVPDAPWTRCVAQLAVQFVQGGAIGKDDLDDVSMSDIAARLSDVHVNTLIIFSTIAAEELREIAHNAHYDKVHKRAVANLPDVLVLIQAFYQRALKNGEQLWTPLLPTCHLQWLKYSKIDAATIESRKAFVSTLSSATSLLLQFRDHSDTFSALTVLLEKALYDLGIEMTDDDLDALEVLFRAEPVTGRLAAFEADHLDEDAAGFGIMALAYSRRRVQKAFLPDSPHTRNALASLEKGGEFLQYHSRSRASIRTITYQVTRALLFEDCDEHLAYAVVGFWEEFVQDTRTHKLRDEAKAFLLGAMETLVYAARSTLPRQDPLSPVDPEDYHVELRSRIRDLLQVAYEEYGMPVAERLVLIVQTSGSNCVQSKGPDSAPWQDLETGLYFLTQLSDSFRFAPETDEEDVEDRALSSVFASAWFPLLLDPRILVPSPVRRLALTFISEYNAYFSRHSAMLWPTLDAILQYLQRPELAPRASDAIKKLCDGNRVVIAKAQQSEKLFDVVKQYFEVDNPMLAPKKALVAGASSVAQALPDEQEALALEGLLTLVLTDHRKQVIAAVADEEHQLWISSASLDLLVAMARACQSPEEPSPYDEEEASQNDGTAAADFWRSGRGAAIQGQIVQGLEEILRTGKAYDTLLNKACNIIKTGYREHQPGPFVLPQSATVGFVSSTPPSHPQFSAIARLVFDFVSTHSADPVRDDAAITSLLLHIVAAIHQQSDPRADPELAAALLDAATRTARASPDFITALAEAPLRALLTFSLAALTSPEPLPKRAAADLWTQLTSALARPASATLDAGRLAALLADAGPHLTAALAFNFGGAAARGELDRLAEPLRHLVARVPATRGWLEGALADPAFNAGRAGDAEKRRFVQALVVLRGGLRSRQVVRDFWLACRGTPAGYG